MRSLLDSELIVYLIVVAIWDFLTVGVLLHRIKSKRDWKHLLVPAILLACATACGTVATLQIEVYGCYNKAALILLMISLLFLVITGYVYKAPFASLFGRDTKIKPKSYGDYIVLFAGLVMITLLVLAILIEL